MAPPVILFGAFDRHNFGDLLFPHIAAALLPGREIVVAGLARRDLRPYGGHDVQALHALGASGRTQGAQLVHAGGEILTCSTRQATAMLLAPQDVDATLAYIEQHPAEEAAWWQAVLGTQRTMPYVVSREELPGLQRVVFDAVGGVALGALPAPWRQAVLRRLAAADALSVRDAATHTALHAAGIEAALMPDPAVMVAALCGHQIDTHAQAAPVAELRTAWPQGYLAVQLAAEFADDATVHTIAAQLDAAAAAKGLGIVLFRAGAAPWHDPADLPARVAQRMRSRQVRLFPSLHLWDLCALLAHASAYAGSSLHGRIVAAAFGVPVVGLVKPQEDAQGGKLAAYAATWEPAAQAALWPVGRLAKGLAGALATSASERQAQAARWVAAYREGFARLMLTSG